MGINEIEGTRISGTGTKTKNRFAFRVPSSALNPVTRNAQRDTRNGEHVNSAPWKAFRPRICTNKRQDEKSVFWTWTSTWSWTWRWTALRSVNFRKRGVYQEKDVIENVLCIKNSSTSKSTSKSTSTAYRSYILTSLATQVQTPSGSRNAPAGNSGTLPDKQKPPA